MQIFRKKYCMYLPTVIFFIVKTKTKIDFVKDRIALKFPFCLILNSERSNECIDYI